MQPACARTFNYNDITTSRAAVLNLTLRHMSCAYRRLCLSTSLGTETETQNRSWFFFSIASLEAGATLRLRVVNLNVQAKLFAGGYTPVWRCPPHRPTWEPTKKGCTFGKGPYGFWIEWVFTLPSDLPALGNATPIFFAFAVPYSTADVETKLRSVSDAFESNAELRESVYYHRSTLVKSCDGRAMPLLTISSMKGRLEAEFDDLDSGDASDLLSVEAESAADGQHRRHKCLYPYSNGGRNGRASADGDGPSCKFVQTKPIIFISARVHPAETMAQWMFDGTLDFLLRLDDPRAAALRERFVFKLVPLVNPDGVARGHQRTDTWGQNLNRCYMAPTPEREPTVYAIREALLDWHQTGRLAIYFDLHAHTSRENAFLFGNFYPDLEAQVDNILLAKLVTLNSQHVDFSNCNFSASGMSKEMHDGTSKSGSGRVALFHATAAAAASSKKDGGKTKTAALSKRVLCYTIECHCKSSHTPSALDDHTPTITDRLAGGLIFATALPACLPACLSPAVNKGRHRNPCVALVHSLSPRCSFAQLFATD